MKKYFLFFSFLFLLSFLFPIEQVQAQMLDAKSPYPYIDYLGDMPSSCERNRSRYGEISYEVCKKSVIIQKNAMIEKNIDGCNDLKTLRDQSYDSGKTYPQYDNKPYASHIETILQQCKTIVRNAIETGHTSLLPPPLNMEQYTRLIQWFCLLIGLCYLLTLRKKINVQYPVKKLILQYILFALSTVIISGFLSFNVTVSVEPLSDIIFIKPSFYSQLLLSGGLYGIIVLCLSYTIFQKLFTDSNRKKELGYLLFIVHPFLFPINLIIAVMHLVRTKYYTQT